MELKPFIADVPDFPKPGIVFKDITPLLADPGAFRETIRSLAAPWKGKGIELLVAAEARGFIFGGALATEMGTGLVPVRKAGKLPRRTVSARYALEYGTDELHMHEDAIARGRRVLVVDDVLATGGTAKAIGDLVRSRGGDLAGYAFVIELAFLGGRAKLAPSTVEALVTYS